MIVCYIFWKREINQVLELHLWVSKTISVYKCVSYNNKLWITFPPQRPSGQVRGGQSSVCSEASSRPELHIYSMWMYNTFNLFSNQCKTTPLLWVCIRPVWVVVSSCNMLHSLTLASNFSLSMTFCFQLLEENIAVFVKSELKRIQRVLSPEYLEIGMEDEEVGNSKKEKSNRAAFLKITLYFLRRMNQKELADSLFLWHYIFSTEELPYS